MEAGVLENTNTEMKLEGQTQFLQSPQKHTTLADVEYVELTLWQHTLILYI